MHNTNISTNQVKHRRKHFSYIPLLYLHTSHTQQRTE